MNEFRECSVFFFCCTDMVLYNNVYVARSCVCLACRNISAKASSHGNVKGIQCFVGGENVVSALCKCIPYVFRFCHGPSAA